MNALWMTCQRHLLWGMLSFLIETDERQNALKLISSWKYCIDVRIQTNLLFSLWSYSTLLVFMSVNLVILAFLSSKSNLDYTFHRDANITFRSVCLLLTMLQSGVLLDTSKLWSFFDNLQRIISPEWSEIKWFISVLFLI